MKRGYFPSLACGLLALAPGPGGSFAQSIPEPEFRMPEWRLASSGAGAARPPEATSRPELSAPQGAGGNRTPHVSDTAGVFSSGARHDLGRQLLEAGRNEGIAVYLQTRSKPPEGSLRDYMEGVLAGAAGTADFAALVLAGEGGRGVPYYYFSGRKAGGLSKSAKQRILERVEAKRLAETGAPDQLRAAALALLGELRSAAASGNGYPAAAVAKAPAPAPAGPAGPARRAGGGFLPSGSPGGWWIGLAAILAGAAAVRFRVRRVRNRPCVFPSYDFRYRFSAPFSGGNDAAIQFAAGKRRVRLVEYPRE